MPPIQIINIFEREEMKWSKYNVTFFSEKLGYCLFNSRTLSFLKLNKETFDIFQNLKEGDYRFLEKLSDSDIKYLLTSKIVVHDNEDDNYLNMLKYKKQLQSYTSRTLGIVVCPTLSCNFACPYCYEHNLPTQSMNEETQQKLIDFINRNSQGMNGINLNWHGGEPLVAFKTIQQIYSKLEQEVKLPLTRTSMVSNGFLLNSNICKYLASKNLNYLQITIDGNKDTHNKSRKLKNGESSFERIIENIDMATELMPNCQIGIRTNISKENKDEYDQLYDTLSKRWKGKKCNVYYAFVQDNGLANVRDDKCSFELSTNEKNDFEVHLAHIGIIRKKTLYPKADTNFYTCMDCNAYVVAPDGKLYKCWADVGITERSIGSLTEGITDYSVISQFMCATDKFSDPKCLQCSYLPICDGGCNLYRVRKIEKNVPYNVCKINTEGLIKYLETYSETL